jgi:hypothetical protein
MSRARLTLTGISVEGIQKPTARIDLSEGLNVVAGASETGKTFIFETIDYLLGAKRPPTSNPASRGYDQGFLGIRETNRNEYVISRVFDSDDVALYESASLDTYTRNTPTRHLGAIHRTGTQDSLSHFLLSLCDLTGHSIRRNQDGERSALTFRHVAHLTLIGEERIISKSSPAVTGQYTSRTLEKALFAFFLTGTADSDLIRQVKPKEQKVALFVEESVLQGLLREKHEALQTLSGKHHDLTAQDNEISQAIERATTFCSSLHEQIHVLEVNRQQQWNSLQKIRSRKLYLAEQMKRFRLLLLFYETDKARLEAMLEAGQAFELLPSGACAACGTPTNEEVIGPVTETTLAQFRSASAEELRKIGLLFSDLTSVITDTERESEYLTAEEQQIDSRLLQIDQELKNTLRPQSVQTSSQITQYLETKVRIAKAMDLHKEILHLQARLESTMVQATQLKRKRARPISQVGTAAAYRFCEVVEAILQAWHFPLRGAVSFDPEQFDIVLGDQNRRSLGKGHRALTHAAFTIGLMRYCRNESIAHPGVVVLDTPLNPYKGPDEEDGGRVNNEIQEAFYEDLARQNSGEQIIVLENTEPPIAVREAVRYHHFSKNYKIGRYGFFPSVTN